MNIFPWLKQQKDRIVLFSYDVYMHILYIHTKGEILITRGLRACLNDEIKPTYMLVGWIR